MISIATPRTTARTRAALTIGAAALAGIGLAACSSGGTITAAKPPAPRAASSSSSNPPTSVSPPPSSNPPASSPTAGTTATGSSPAAGMGTSHPCALLTQADVTTAIGQPVGTGTVQAKAGASACTYDSTDGSIAGGLIAVSTWKNITDVFRTNKITLTPISGLGDQAGSGFSGAQFPALVVREDSIGFEISIHGPHISASPDHGLATAENLARLVLSRLQPRKPTQRWPADSHPINDGQPASRPRATASSPTPAAGRCPPATAV